MKILVCPLNGPRNISEFVYGGEAVGTMDPETASDGDWADYVFGAGTESGVVREWWFHVPTAYWFIAERHTGTDEVLRTYPASEVFGPRGEAGDGA
ncbi:MAG: sarcosine oxidase subunit delta [Defluviicoccus sp.]|nr:sarcosine oxidase subunit delta [Defluviicoccus sp.]MDE0382728.1 sarcosine oxidase subunit delta [Defluviicoccus sp.]